MVLEIDYVMEGGSPLLLLSKEERAEIELAVAADAPLADEFQKWADSKRKDKGPEPSPEAYGAWARNEGRANELLTDDLIRAGGFTTARFEIREQGPSDKRECIALRRRKLKGVEDYEEWGDYERMLFMAEACYEHFRPVLLSGWPEDQPLPACFVERLSTVCYSRIFPEFEEGRRRFLAQLRPGNPPESPSP